MKILFILVSALLVFYGESFSAGFDDPWSKGSGFDNPWESQSARPEPEKPKPEKQEKKRPVKQDSRQPTGNSFPNGVNPMPPAIPSAPPVPSGAENGGSNRQPASAALPDSSNPDYNKPPVVSVKKSMTPLGHGAADDMTDVKGGLMMSNFTYGGKCGDGDIYFLEPALACVAIAIRGGSNGLAGSATWVSSDCYEKNPALLTPYMNYARQGKKYKTGWENNVNYNGFMQCVEKGGVGTLTDLEPFLGMIHPFMPMEVVNALLMDSGAKIVKRYKNGIQYDYLGASVFCEYCMANGRIIRIGLQVNSENPEIREKIKKMNLLKSGARYGDVVVYFEKKDNLINKIQWQCNDAERNCGKKNVG